MELDPYIETVRRELTVAAAAGGDEARALAERLTAPLESAIRLALLDALSAAATEITHEIAPGSVDLRLRGREPSFVVTPPSLGPGIYPADDQSADGPAPRAEDLAPPPASEGSDGAVARINFRLPEHLKGRIEQAASQSQLSINSWLIRAATAAADSAERGRHPEWPSPQSGRRYTGWVR